LYDLKSFTFPTPSLTSLQFKRFEQETPSTIAGPDLVSAQSFLAQKILTHKKSTKKSSFRTIPTPFTSEI
jgi:hypothetical protein